MSRKLKHLLRAAGKNKLSLTTKSIGLDATILLVFFIPHEWSYDRYFSKADNIYRLNSIWIEALGYE